MMIPAKTLQDALAVALIAVYPAWDFWDTRKLRQGTDPREKLHYYKKTLVLEWIAAVVAVWAVGPKIFVMQAGPPQFAADHATAYRIVAWALAALIAWAVLNPHVRALRSPKTKAAVIRALAKLQFFLPKTEEERRWFVALSITAGVCEEVLFRGFLIRYLGIEPRHLGLTLAVILAALVFGAAHLYQGLQGFVNSTIGGVIFSAVFLLTGSLALPIVFHAAADYLLVPILRAGEAGSS